jgi:hypothetical protein
VFGVAAKEGVAIEDSKMTERAFNELFILRSL